MTGRKSFIMYSDYKQHIDLLSDEEKGKLFSALFDYIETGEAPLLPPMATMAFSFIKLQLDRDWEKYQAIVERNHNNGLRGGRPRKNETDSEEPKKPSGLSGNPNEPSKTQLNPKKHDNGTDNGTDNVNDNGTVFSTAEKPGFSLPTLSEISEYFSETHCTIDPERFFNYYQKKNWIGNDGLVIDWKKALAGWESREGKRFEVKHTSVRKKQYEGLVE